jgi:hypothetical protein
MSLSRREEVAKILHVNGVLLWKTISEFSQNGVVPRAPKFPAPGGFGRFSPDPSMIIRSTQTLAIA